MSSFDFLQTACPELARLGAQAEALVTTDPHGCIAALGQFADALTEELFSVHKLPLYEDYGLFERVERLRHDDLIAPGAVRGFHALRMAREDVDRGKLKFSPEEAAFLLNTAQQLAQALLPG